ncbi:transporter substrate-binding domain-containing protein [Sulfurimonas sp.]|nr:transporter substrate-binding domain-containing protein [Sulfurimonas sp.]
MKAILLVTSIFFLSLSLPAKALTISSGFSEKESVLVYSVLSEMFKRANIELDYQVLPNQRSLLNANNGVSDGDATRIWNIDKMYPNLIRVPVQVHSLDLVLISNKKLNFKDLSDLKNYNVGVIRGMKIAEKTVAKHSPKSVTAGTNHDQIMMMLESGRIDVVVAAKIEFYLNLENSKSDTLYLHKKTILSLPLYPQLHKKNKAYIAKLRDALQSMHDDGTYKEIQNMFLNGLESRHKDKVKVTIYD